MGAAAKLPKKPGIQKLTPLSSAAAIVGALMSTPRTKTNCLSLEHVIPRPPNNWESRHRIKGVRVALANSVAREGDLWRKCHIALRSTQAMQLGTSSREPLAQFGHLVLQPALGGHQFGAALADDGARRAKRGSSNARRLKPTRGGAPARQRRRDRGNHTRRDPARARILQRSRRPRPRRGARQARPGNQRETRASDLRELRRHIAGVNSVLAEVRAADREHERVVDL